ncbi:HAD family phosphatase [Variovorax paradoxus]|nr:HAD family phosphatase [Variovorax paradoxus]MBT2300876.1 HAD family phosphatase [Variovorax paradoxus]
MSITLVLFDLDGVLCDYDRSARVAHLAALTGQGAEAVRRAIWDSGLEARADAGLMSGEDYLRELGVLMGRRITLDDWLAARRAATTPNAPVLELARAVAARRRVAVLTNNSRLLTDHLHRVCPEVGELFDEGTILSTASYGATKPAPQAYLRCLEELGTTPAGTLFIDDVDSNVAGAIQAGLQAYKFIDTEALAQELAARGLI